MRQMPCGVMPGSDRASHAVPSWTFGPISIHPDYKRKGYFVADKHPEAFEAYDATFPPKEKLRLPGQLGYEE